MANRGYDVVVDVDAEVKTNHSHCSSIPQCTRYSHQLQGDLGHTDLQEDLEFHSSSMSLSQPDIQISRSYKPTTQTSTPTLPPAANFPPATNPSSPKPPPPRRAPPPPQNASSGPSPSTPNSSTSTQTKSSAAAAPLLSLTRTSSTS